VNNICPATHHRRLEIGLERQRYLGGPTDDEVGLDRQWPQQLEQPRSVDHTGGAADPDNQTGASGFFCHRGLFEFNRSVIFALQVSGSYGLPIQPALPSTAVTV
jgi:hypothetical protein